jgi:hypothetical protein
MKSGNQAQEGRFPAARGAQKGEELSIVNFQGYLADRLQGAKSLNEASKQNIHKKMILFLIISQKVVSPVETGIQNVFKFVKSLDSGFRQTENGTFRLLTRSSFLILWNASGGGAPGCTLAWSPPAKR